MPSAAGHRHPIDDIRSATCSDGAPSARNLIVTVFGDVVLPSGAAAELTVAELAALLSGFGVNDRLVRTSLSRIVNDGLLVARTQGRRSFYRVAPDAVELFRTADRRIYRSSAATWDGAWTLVVLDGNESTSARRARLRQELAWAGLGTVAPNVMASPVVEPDVVVDTVARVGGFANVLVSRSTLREGDGLLGRDELVRRAVELDGLEAGYAAFSGRFAALSDVDLDGLDDALALKTRLLLVSTFRRVALVDPQLPTELLPSGWVGERARREADRVYRAVSSRSDRCLADLTGLAVVSDPTRFAR